ncbi:MAG: trypsin-like peptidase domain-containing protein [Clostridia bacterium]|nr:trypsin-like peptidase domain-containing protein [Clostridia bacterium]
MTKTKKKIITVIVCIIVAVAVLISILFIVPAVYDKKCQNRVFEDMQLQLDKVKTSVIGIIPKTVNEDGSINYSGGGSGVVFEKKDGTYYALSAGHVVADQQATFKVYTDKTQYNTVDNAVFEQFGIEVVESDFYDSLSDAKVEYVSSESDIAIVSFRSDDDLTVAELTSKDLSKGDRIVCLGHPENKQLTVTYGNITVPLKTINDKSKTYVVTEHNAYLNFGNSGGGAFSEDMKLTGINTGGYFTTFHYFQGGIYVPSSQLQKFIQEWKSQ